MRLVVLLLGSSVLACTAVGSGPSSEATAGPPLLTESVSRPIATDLSPVSASDPDVVSVLQFCEVADHLEMVAGMARVPRAREAWRYVAVADSIHFQTDAPVWVVQLRGEFPQFRPVGVAWIDPVCFMIEGGDAGFVKTGPARRPDGSIASPRPVSSPPVEALPPLTP